MNYLLVDTIKHLKTSDIELIRRHLQVVNAQNKPSQRQRLFEYLLEYPNAKTESVSKYIYGTIQTSATIKLMERLENEILAILSIEGVTHSNFSEVPTARLLVNSWLASYQFLRIRGANRTALKLLNRGRKVCSQFEFLAQDLIFLTMVRDSYYNKNQTNFEKYSREIELQLRRIEAVNRSQTLLGLFSSKTHAQKTITDVIRKEMEEISLELKMLYDETKLVKIKFAYLRARIYTLMLSGQHLKSYDSGLELLDLAQNSQAVRSKSNLAGCHMILADICLNIEKNERAIFFANAAIELFRKDSLNYMMAIEYLFTGQLRSNELLAAENTLKLAIKSPGITLNSMIESKWLFYQAALHFMRGEFTSALRILNRNLEITKDKTGWLASVKILEIMCYLDLREYDMADYRIEALRHMLINPQKTDQLARLQKITKLLNGLRKSLYDWREFHKKNKVAIEEFLTKEVWHKTDVDIVNFNTWLERKCERLPPITNS